MKKTESTRYKQGFKEGVVVGTMIGAIWISIMLSIYFGDKEIMSKEGLAELKENSRQEALAKIRENILTNDEGSLVGFKVKDDIEIYEIKLREVTKDEKRDE